MENIAKELVPFLQYLLPGFLTAWVFYGLTPFLVPSQFERIVQALIFTVIIIQLFVPLERYVALIIGRSISIGTWTKESELVSSLITACVLGALFAYFANNDTIHKLARKIKITKETSYPSEWSRAFFKNITYVVIHLEGERRLSGWPRVYPSNPDRGHFIIENPSWLNEDNEEIPITNVSSIMIDVKHVEMVEFMTKTYGEKNNGKEEANSTTKP